MKTGRGHNESRLHGIRKACARRSKMVVAADAAVVDSVATTAMPMSFEQAQLGANVTDPLLSRRRWSNGPGTEGDRIRGKRGARNRPAMGSYRRAKCLLSGEDFHRHRHLSGWIFKILCAFSDLSSPTFFSSKDDAWLRASSKTRGQPMPSRSRATLQSGWYSGANCSALRSRLCSQPTTLSGVSYWRLPLPRPSMSARSITGLCRCDS